jgi:hypothetical protein
MTTSSMSCHNYRTIHSCTALGGYPARVNSQIEDWKNRFWCHSLLNVLFKNA